RRVLGADAELAQQGSAEERPTVAAGAPLGHERAETVTSRSAEGLVVAVEEDVEGRGSEQRSLVRAERVAPIPHADGVRLVRERLLKFLGVRRRQRVQTLRRVGLGSEPERSLAEKDAARLVLDGLAIGVPMLGALIRSVEHGRSVAQVLPAEDAVR